MPNWNNVSLMGNLCRDPELRYTPKGTAVAKLSLAINRSWKSESGETKEEVTFVDVDVFGRTAEAVAKYCKKGKSVFISGRLKLDQWEKDGKKHQKLGVVGEQVQFLGSKDEGGAEREPERAPAARPAAAPSAPKTTEEDDDSVPF